MLRIPLTTCRVWIYMVEAVEHCQDLIWEFIALLDPDKHYDWFQHDNAQPHISRESMAMLQEFFNNRLISAGWWSPQLSDLNPLDLFLWSYNKDRAYINTPTIHSRNWRRILLPLSMQFHVRCSNMWQSTPSGGHTHVSILRVASLSTHYNCSKRVVVLWQAL